MTGGHGLLSPGTHRAAARFDDAAFVSAVVSVEAAWLRALASVGAIDAADAAAAEQAVLAWRVDLDTLLPQAEAAGSPVVALVAALRASISEPRLAKLLHRGLTSQDVVDTALVLMARDALADVAADLAATAASLAGLADRHRDTVMVGRTLTQHAVPITFGLKAARWLDGVLDALDDVDRIAAALPVQCGGAAGTLALVAETTDPVAAAQALADELGLVWPGLPWHTNRAPIGRISSALVGSCTALGVLANDVTLLSRPEIAEVHEEVVAGRGGSSTMPHKRNPVLSLLVRSAALQAPQLGAQLALAASLAVDERPDGGWHTEWPALQRLYVLTVTAASQAAELAAGLQADPEAMRARADGAADSLLAERGGGELDTYLGASSTVIDTVLARLTNRGSSS